MEFGSQDTYLFLGLGAIALLAYMYTVEQAQQSTRQVGKAVAKGTGAVYRDAKSVAKTGYKDAKTQGGKLKGWLRKRF